MAQALEGLLGAFSTRKAPFLMEQLCYIFLLPKAKTVLSLASIERLMRIRLDGWAVQIAYQSPFVGDAVDGAVDLGLQHVADALVLVPVLAGLRLQRVAPLYQVPSLFLPAVLRLLQVVTQVAVGPVQRSYLLTPLLQLSAEGVGFPLTVGGGPGDHVVLVGILLLEFAEEVVEVVVLAVEVAQVLPQLVDLLGPLRLHLPDHSLLVLEGPQQLLVLAHQHFLGLLHHLHLLLAVAGHLLGALDLLVPGPVLDVSDLFLKVELVADEDVVEFLVFHRHVLPHESDTFLLSYRALHFSSRFLIFRSQSKLSCSTYSCPSFLNFSNSWLYCMVVSSKLRLSASS